MQAHVKFNSWELESSTGAWLDLQPTSAPRHEGADWWSADIAVPSNAYEMSYIFSDGTGTTDNNSGLDYGTEIDGHMTRQTWAEAAPERMVLLPGYVILPLSISLHFNCAVKYRHAKYGHTLSFATSAGARSMIMVFGQDPLAEEAARASGFNVCKLRQVMSTLVI